MTSWIRKEQIENVVAGKHATNKSRVRCLNAKGGVPVGTIGVVVSTGTAEGWAAKRATGTTKAMKVAWEL